MGWFHRTQLYCVWNAGTPAIRKTGCVFCSIFFWHCLNCIVQYIYTSPCIHSSQLNTYSIFTVWLCKTWRKKKPTKKRSGSGFSPQAAAERPNSCAAQGSRPWPCMFSIYSGIYMSPKLQAHEWAPVCSFGFDVTSSVWVGHSVPRQVFQKNCVPAQKHGAMLIWSNVRLARLCRWVKNYCNTKSMLIIYKSVEVIFSVCT